MSETVTQKQRCVTIFYHSLYDAVGNRLSSLSGAYAYNASNELTSDAAGNSYTYDANGNTLTKTNPSGTTTYAWDFENRLSSVTLPGSGGTVSFKYDPFGRRIQKVSSAGTTNFAYDGDSIMEELDSTGTSVARYAQGLGIDEPLAELRSGVTSYYEADGLGSVTSLSNSAGALTNTYVYDSFGNLTASTGSVTNPYRFTAREFDSETGLYYYRARYYDSTTGRFLSEDPIRIKGGINFYAYVGNNAVNRTDPEGRAFVDCIDALAELVAATANVLGRVADMARHAGSPDPMQHGKALQQAVNRLKKALDRVKEHCACYAGAAAAIAAAESAIDAAAPYLLGAAAATL